MTEPHAEAVDFEFEVGDRHIAFELSEAIYPRDVVFGAAYLFIDRCYVFLSQPASQKVLVRLRRKDRAQASPEVLEALAGEFANELLNQLLRARVGEATSKIREAYMARAFSIGESKSTISQLLAELDDEELADDELEVEVPWKKANE